MKAIKILILSVVALAAVGTSEGLAFCMSCRAVECWNDVQCGAACQCVTLNGNIKGNCVSQY
jgi:hypothetical protein